MSSALLLGWLGRPKSQPNACPVPLANGGKKSSSGSSSSSSSCSSSGSGGSGDGGGGVGERERKKPETKTTPKTNSPSSTTSAPRKRSAASTTPTLASSAAHRKRRGKSGLAAAAKNAVNAQQSSSLSSLDAFLGGTRTEKISASMKGEGDASEVTAMELASVPILDTADPKKMKKGKKEALMADTPDPDPNPNPLMAKDTVPEESEFEPGQVDGQEQKQEQEREQEQEQEQELIVTVALEATATATANDSGAESSEPDPTPPPSPEFERATTITRPPPSPQSEKLVVGGMSDYEAMRLRNMQENQRMLMAMGLLSAAAAAPLGSAGGGRGGGGPKKKASKSRPFKRRSKSTTLSSSLTGEAPETTNYVRRSSRRISSRRSSAAAAGDDTGTTFSESGPGPVPVPEPEPVPEPVPEVGTAFPSFGGSRAAVPFASRTHLLSSGSALGARLLTGHGHNVYSMDVLPLVAAAAQSGEAGGGGGSSAMLCVAGKRGVISFYDLNAPQAQKKKEEEGEVECEYEEYEGEEPIFGAKAHKRWISEVQYVGPGPDTENNGALIASAADDGALVLSEFTTVIHANGTRGTKATSPAAKLLPLARRDALHAGRGIFSMHVRNNRILTCSKDGTAAVTPMTTTSLEGGTLYDDFSGGVLKCARWQPDFADGFAVCGNDRCVYLFDARAPSSPQRTLEDAHAGAVNALAFAPNAPHTLATSGSDGIIHLWDARHDSVPRASLSGHHARRAGKSSLTHPVFFPADGSCHGSGGGGGGGIDNGLLTVGDGAPHLFHYDTQRACIRSRIYVGYTATCLRPCAAAAIDGVGGSGGGCGLAAAHGTNAVWYYPNFESACGGGSGGSSDN
eukprot:UC1_evm1s1554